MWAASMLRSNAPGGRAEALGAVGLPPEGLDDADADGALLGHLGHLADPLLHVDQHGVGAAAVAPGHRQQRGPHQQREQRQDQFITSRITVMITRVKPA